jgi:predicted NBD/HSP70 family sugar kinase
VAGVTRAKPGGSGGGGAFRPEGKVLPKDARGHNRALLLDLLRRHGPLSRADLVRSTELTAASVSDLVVDLLDEGMVVESGRRSAGVGKPATLLAIVPDARHVVCLDLSDQSRLVGAVVNVTGTVLVRRTLDRDGRTGDDALRLATDLARQLVEEAEAPVVGVGVGTPGVVHAGGVVQDASNLAWHHLPLADQLATALDAPVHVMNDANAAVLGEFQFGVAPGPNLLVVKMGMGVGAGLVLGGHLVEGDDSAAGEIGHVVVDEGGPQCACGNRGCLETLVAGELLADRLAELDDQGRVALLQVAGEALGSALAPVISMLNLHAVVLSGLAGVLGEPFRHAVAAILARRTFPLVSERLEVRFSTTGGDDVLLGAAAVVLREQVGVR